MREWPKIKIAVMAGETDDHADCFATYGPLAVTRHKADGPGRLYAITGVETGMKLSTIFGDGLTACECAEALAAELPTDFWVAVVTQEEKLAKRTAVAAIVERYTKNDAWLLLSEAVEIGEFDDDDEEPIT